jgi:hypothetical protein
MQARDVIFVLGTPRSGTSALTRVVSLCGGELPSRLLAARDFNPTGVWEPVDAVMLNQNFLLRHHDAAVERLARLHDHLACSETDGEAFIGAIRDFLSRCSGGSRLVIKENNIPILLRFWVEAAQRERLAPKVVICVRRPQEVLASWVAWGAKTAIDLRAVPAEHLEPISVSLLARNLIMERATRELTRVFVDYGQLLADWQTQMSRVSAALSVSLEQNATAVDGFLSESLHRQRSTGPLPAMFCSSWIAQAHDILSRAATDLMVDTVALDRIRDAYRESSIVARLARRFRHGVDQKQLLEEFSRWPVWESGRDF